MSDENTTKRFAVSAGILAFALAGIGWTLRLIGISGDAGRRGIESTDSSKIMLGGTGTILLIVAGLLAIYGAAKNDGRIPALLALGALALFALSLSGVLK